MDWSKIKSGDDFHDLKQMVDTIRSKNQSIISGMREATAAYFNRDMVSFRPGQWRNSRIYSENLTYNVFRSCTDTITAKITQAQPRAKVSTFGGSVEDQERAYGLEKLIAGVMQSENGFCKTREAFRHSCIYPIGVIRHYIEDGSVKLRVLHPSRVLIDEDVALDKPPNVFIQIEDVDKEQLLARYPDSASIIEQSKIDYIPEYGRLTEVWEIFKEPCGKEPGCHILACSSGVIQSEEWNDLAPFSVIKWSSPLLGWYGSPLWEELKGIQTEIDFWMSVVRKSARLNSVPYLLLPLEAQVSDEDVETNELGRIVRYAGPTPPTVATPDIASQQVFNYIETLFQRAYEISGISMLSASSRKPAGLESGAAIREYNDSETIRFSHKSYDYEEFIVDVARKIIDNAKRLASSNKVFINVLEEDFSLKNIDFQDVDMDRDKFKIYIQPASALPLSPAARLQRVLELARDQLINAEQFHAMARMPDLEKFDSLESSEYRIFEKTFEKMVKTGEYISPNPYTNIQLGLRTCAKFYTKGWVDDVEPDKLGVLERWMEEAKEMLIPDQPMMPMEQMNQQPMAPQPVDPAEMSL